MRRRIIYKNSPLKLLSHWKRKAADQLAFSFCLFLTHKPHTKTHSLSPPHHHRHRQTHTYALTQPKRARGAERRMIHTVTPQWSCGTVIRCAFVMRTHKKQTWMQLTGKNNSDLFKTTAADCRPCSQMTYIRHHILILMNITSQMGCAMLQVPVFIRRKTGWRFNAILIVTASGHRWHFVDLTTLPHFFILFLQYLQDAMEFTLIDTSLLYAVL